MAIDDHRRVFPDRTGIDQVVLDAGAAGHPHAAIDPRRNGNPAAVADRRHELAAGGTLPHEFEHLLVATEFVGHPAAGEYDALKVARLHVADRRVARARIAVFSDIRAALQRAGHGDVGPCLLQAKFGIPEFQVLVVVTDEHENAAAIEQSRGNAVGMHDGISSIKRRAVEAR